VKNTLNSELRNIEQNIEKFQSRSCVSCEGKNEVMELCDMGCAVVKFLLTATIYAVMLYYNALNVSSFFFLLFLYALKYMLTSISLPLVGSCFFYHGIRLGNNNNNQKVLNSSLDRDWRWRGHSDGVNNAMLLIEGETCRTRMDMVPNMSELIMMMWLQCTTYIYMYVYMYIYIHSVIIHTPLSHTLGSYITYSTTIQGAYGVSPTILEETSMKKSAGKSDRFFNQATATLAKNESISFKHRRRFLVATVPPADIDHSPVFCQVVWTFIKIQRYKSPNLFFSCFFF
jgi:hypothetical protein